MPRIQKLPRNEITVDPGLQVRVELNAETRREYAEALLDDADLDLPPVIVFFDGKKYWLADGFHRVGAYLSAYRDMIPCEIREGSRRDALAYALSANTTNGLRRTNADKRRAVEIALKDEEWGKWSDQQVAKLCGVSPPTVAAARSSLKNFYSEPELMTERGALNALKESLSKPEERTYTTKHGTTATMKTGNIGRKPAPEVPPPPKREERKEEPAPKKQSVIRTEKIDAIMRLWLELNEAEKQHMLRVFGSQ